MRLLHLLLGLTLLVGAGCQSGQPDQGPAANAQAVVADDATRRDSVLDLRTPENTAAGSGAAAVVTADPMVSTSPTTPTEASTPESAAAPSTGVAPAAPTVPTTRPPVSAPTTEPIATTPPPTTATTTVTTPPPTSPATTDQPTQPQSGVVEFRIRAGTGNGPWNSVDDPVRVTVGQVLRIHNDDSVAHTAHSNGRPFAHGPSIPAGGFADHPIVEPLTPDPAAPSNYDHDAGPGAAFWVVAVEAGSGATGAGGPTELAEAEAESLRLVNDLRAGLGLQAVRPIDDEMHTFARAWALEMRRTGFRHSDPPPWFENIVWYSDETMTPSEAAAQFHEMWVGSPGHYRNMTNPEWSIIGVGMWHDESGWWGVHVFR